MTAKVVEKSEIGPLISPQSNQHIPVHNWYSFKHGYSRDLVIYLIKSFALSEGAWVLDPFCGSGTTLLTCKELGINAKVFDILPYSAFLSNVKVSDYDNGELAKQLSILKKRGGNGHSCRGSLPNMPLVKKAFSPDVEEALIKLKSKIDSIPTSRERLFFNLGFLSIVELVSNTTKSGGFLRIVNRDVSPKLIETLFWDKVNSMLSDVKQSNNYKQNKKVHISAEIADARKLPTQRKFDSIITSPPYPNRHDYTRIYSLEMIFDFVSTNQELKKIRYETIRSHVEARKKFEAFNYEKPIILDKLITDIKKNGTNNPRVIDMLNGYFEDMYLCLSEMHRCLKDNGKIGLVVSNVRFAGINIPVDEILSEIGVQVGLTPKEIWVARYRGNSSQQMRDYNRKPSRESVVIWEKHAN